ncbi:hypothetical protein [Shewanella frigidimarina]|uniref:RES domain-containing protein n=1 Tax=Shewanella frigidimarina TaxID=56812 RepID=A0A106BZM8_SHEFR|nr:hypothetical protein [Shewanella frigidimarina]KVX01444.1 hypothetical protein AWJ07_17605 [Shewanella frigidimarina]
MLAQNVKKLIDDKAMDLNSQGDLADYVSKKITILNDYIEGKRELSEPNVDDILSEIVGFFTTSLDIPLEEGTKFLRARTYKVNHLEVNVPKLSYIPLDLSELATLGRLNKEKEPVYYGCIYFEEKGGVNVAFSESNAEVSDNVNILRSTAKCDVNVNYVGIYDYVHRQCKPRFMPQSMFEYFEAVSKYQEEKFSESVFLAHLLCDAFLSDILRRKKSGNLYRVTSILFSIYTESSDIDGIMYTSVKSEGDPVVALKTESVNSKLVHKSCDNYRIINDYGYAKYHAIHTHYGSISGNSVSWLKKNT